MRIDIYYAGFADSPLLTDRNYILDLEFYSDTEGSVDFVFEIIQPDSKPVRFCNHQLKERKTLEVQSGDNHKRPELCFEMASESNALIKIKIHAEEHGAIISSEYITSSIHVKRG